MSKRTRDSAGGPSGRDPERAVLAPLELAFLCVLPCRRDNAAHVARLERQAEKWADELGDKGWRLLAHCRQALMADPC